MINRDGTLVSLWQATADPYPSRNIPFNRTFDVVIAGGGITGITTALLLQEAGMRCLVLEAKNICYGTTGGTTAHLNTFLDTPYHTIQKKFSKEIAKQVAHAAAEALNLVRENIERFEINCGFREANAFLFATNKDQEEELDEISEASAAAGLEVMYSETIPVSIPFTKAISVSNQAQFHPVRYVYALANAFEEMGGTIIQQCRVTDLKEGTPLTIETSSGNFVAGQLIYATHTPPGINLLQIRCVPYRSYAMAVELEDLSYPDELTYDMEDPYHYYRTQDIDGRPYLIAGGKDHKTGKEENTEARLMALEATIRGNFKVRKILHKWSSQYFEPGDGLPYIGKLPGNDNNVFVATGFGGNGMTYSHVAAIILRDIITREANPAIQTDLFSPGRIKPVAGFTSFIAHQADVAKNYLGRLSDGEQISQVAEIAPGEGRIVEFDSKKIGIYKNETGELFAVSPVCAHLKCEVRWNGAEKSWDCPCHGARYDITGAVITGPAEAPLGKIEFSNVPEYRKTTQ